MKPIVSILLLSSTLALLNCKDTSVKNKEITIENSATSNTSSDLQQVTSNSIAHKNIKVYDNKFVIATSGLNYRDAPKGKVLGKFLLNTPLSIIEYTNIKDQVDEGNTVIKGEWVGVLRDNNSKIADTVYVFNGYLSYTKAPSNVKVYNASIHQYSGEVKKQTPFLNVSQTYFLEAFNENGVMTKNKILTKNNLLNEAVNLNANQRNEFLKNVSLNENDTIYIYFYKKNFLKKVPVSNAPVMAFVNPYDVATKARYDEMDYMFGFNLEKDITQIDDNYVTIGSENPFQTGKMKPIIWSQIDNNAFTFNPNVFKEQGAIATYYFTTLTHDYYLQQSQQLDAGYQLVIVDKLTKAEILNNHYYNGEASFITPLKFKDKKSDDIPLMHWTGVLFKNKPPVLVGLLQYSYGCASVAFLDLTEPEIPVLCDNRH